MKHKVPIQGPVVKEVPIELILFDKHQPRKTISKEGLQELALSIRGQGLQELPTLNVGPVKKGKQYYYIKFGETRVRAHTVLKRQRVLCIIRPEKYDGAYNPDRDLQQASENGCRTAMSNTDLVSLVKRQVDAEIEKQGGREHGAIGTALRRIDEAFGKSEGWAKNLYALARLDTSILPLIDGTDGVRLSIVDAGKLAVAPLEEQNKILKGAMVARKKGGRVAMIQYITQRAHAIRAERGEKVRGRKPYDDKVSFERLIATLERMANNVIAGRKPDVFEKYLLDIVSRLGSIETDVLLRKIEPSLAIFSLIQLRLKEHRARNYKKVFSS